MKMPFDLIDNIDFKRLDGIDADLVLYLDHEIQNIECEFYTKFLFNDKISIDSFYNKIYIKDKTYEIDCLVRKLRNYLREKFPMVNENTYIIDDVTIKLHPGRKTRDVNGVIIEEPFNILYIEMYSKFEKQKMTVKEYNRRKKPAIVLEETTNDENFIYNCFNIENNFLNQINLLKELL